MRFTPTRVPPPDDSPAPGVIPATVQVHVGAQRAARPTEHSPRPARPRLPAVALHRRFHAGHRS
jgi:hypothetical protein